MINYIGNIIKNRARKKIHQTSPDPQISSNNNLANSPPNNNIFSQNEKNLGAQNNGKNPSSLLWVFKINFNVRPESHREDISRKKSIGIPDNVVNDEKNNASINKMINIKMKKIENILDNDSNVNFNHVLLTNGKNSAFLDTPLNNRRDNIKVKAKSPDNYNRLSGVIKTSQEKHRRHIMKNEPSNENKSIKIKEILDSKEKDNKEDNKDIIKEISVSPPKKKKIKIVKEKLNSMSSKTNNLCSNEKEIKNNIIFEANEVINKKDISQEKLLKSLELPKTNSKKIKKKKKKNKKNKKKKEENNVDNDIVERIKQNLLNLFEKQKMNNRLDVKKSMELPKIENRLPEQKIEKFNSPTTILRKVSSPNLNNNNINFNNPISSAFYIKLTKPEVKIEINPSFFKKPFEYLSSFENYGDSSTISYNSYIYNKDYLKSIERISKVFLKSLQPIPQIQPIQLTNYTYVNFVRSDVHIVAKVMNHRKNWTYTISNKYYNFRWNYSTKGLEYNKLVNSNDLMDKQKVVNHFEYHTEITDKKRLFINLLKFCDLIDFDLFKIVPFTIIICYRKEVFDENMKSFTELFNAMSEIKRRKNDGSYNPKALNGISTYYETIFNKTYTDLFDITERERYYSSKITMSIPHSFFAETNLWIIKPSDLCQGNCMKISNDLAKITKKVRKFFSGVDQTYKDSDDEEVSKKRLEIQLSYNNNNEEKKGKKEKCYRYYSSTVLLQKYLENPLLYMNRKFDIRVWVLIDQDLNVYVFKEGHLKCSSEIYDVNNKNQFIHITNYSVQKYSNNFEKYEFGNEVSFTEFQKFLDSCSINIDVYKDIMFKLKRIIEITAYSANRKLNKKNAKYCFEILGYDFIIDCNFDVWLLEVNDNPGLCESSPLIKILVPRMMDDAFRLTIDKIFQTKYSNGIYENNIYKSPFPVENYSDEENMFEFICNVNVDEEEYCKNLKIMNLA